jgi:hypothetical protein
MTISRILIVVSAGGFHDSCGLDKNVAAKYDKQVELHTDWQ